LVSTDPILHRMRVIAGGLADVRIGGITVSFLADDEAYLYVPDADVEEQDRYLALSRPRDIIVEDKNLLKAFTRVHEEQPRDLGTVHLLRGVLRAVIIDVDSDVHCDPVHIERAAREVIRVSRDNGLVNVRMPVLGSRHGGLAVDVAARAIAAGFLQAMGDEQVNVAIVAPRDVLPKVAENFTNASTMG
jgi:hypothetical protein